MERDDEDDELDDDLVIESSIRWWLLKGRETNIKREREICLETPLQERNRLNPNRSSDCLFIHVHLQP